MQSLLGWLSQYGYAGLFGLLVFGIVGVPVPDETLLVFSGYLIATGRLHPLLTFMAAFGGSICGISLSYTIGLTMGHPFIVRYGKYLHVTEARLEHVHHWFQRIGEWLLMAGYFIPGVRHFTALVAGTSKLEYRTFAVFAYSGAAIWVAAFLAVGYFVGENWQAAVSLVHRYTLAFAGFVLLAAIIVWWVRKRGRVQN